VKQGGENKCWRCGGPHKKKDYLNPLQATTSNHNPSQPFPIIMHMNMTSIIVLHLTQNYDRANHKTPMLIRAKVLRWARRGKNGKVQPIKGSATKLAQGQPNTMEARFV